MSLFRRRRLLSWRFRRSAGPALHLTQGQLTYVDDVKGRIATGRYRLVCGECPCGAEAATLIAEIDRYGIELNTVLCEACGTLRFNPYLTPESVSEFYRTQYQDMYARADDPKPYFAKQRQYGERLLRWIAHNGAKVRVVAEVGCGAGGALAVFHAAGLEVYGCDYSQRLVEYGSSTGVPNIVCGDIQALQHKMDGQGRRADIVFLHHVFEHLDNPLAWLTSAKALLAEDAMIVVAVPDAAHTDAYPSTDGDLRKFLHIAHKFNYTFDGMHALARRTKLHAMPVDVEPSGQAPEMWVAFSVAPLGASTSIRRSPWRGTPAQLWKRLRKVEERYLRRAVVRRLNLYWSTFARKFMVSSPRP